MPPLHVQTFHDPSEFLLAIRPLAAHPDQNFPLLDHAQVLAGDWDGGHRGSFMATIEAPGGVMGAAAGAWPDTLVLSRMEAPAAVALAEEVARRGLRVSGLFGPETPATACAGHLVDLGGLEAKTRYHFRLFRADAVLPVPTPPGRPRLARDEDVALLTDWDIRFMVEAGESPPLESQRSMQAYLNFGGVYLWDDEGAASMTMARRTIDREIDWVSFVFTPPERRRRGYAAALVAEATARHLRGGSRCCLLYARVQDELAHRLYARVGYRACGDFVNIWLTPPPPDAAEEPSQRSPP